MTNYQFILACTIFAALGFAGFALYRCWNDAERGRAEKWLFTLIILICPFLGPMVFFRAQEAKGKVSRELRFRPGTGSGEDRSGDRPERKPSRPDNFGEKSGLETPKKREWKTHPRQK